MFYLTPKIAFNN